MYVYKYSFVFIILFNIEFQYGSFIKRKHTQNHNFTLISFNVLVSSMNGFQPDFAIELKSIAGLFVD